MFDVLYPLTLDYYKEKRYVKLLHSCTQAVINKRRDHLLEENKVLLDLLLDKTLDGKPLPDRYIREEVDTFMFEGHDTTASAIGFTLYCLANHKEVQETVLSEQIEVFGENLDQEESYAILQDMKYLEQVIKESLRLYPSVPFYARQITKDIVTRYGNLIPKGVSVNVFAFGVNRDPSIYKNPDKFKRERFNKVSTKPYTYLPFSAGPRNCIGQKFAMLEIKSVISKLVRSFKIFPTNPKHEVIISAETVLKSVNGVKLKIMKRVL